MERIETMNTGGGMLAGKNSTGKSYNDSTHHQAEEIILTPAQAAAEASSSNPSHRYNLSKKENRNSKNVAIAYDNDNGNSNNNNKGVNTKTISNSCKSIIRIWFDACIDTIAYVIARIINHPDVRDAVSTAILEGMIKVCYDDNLYHHIKNVDATLSEYQVEGATKKGKDAQKIVKAYLGGIFNLDSSSDSTTTNNDTEGSSSGDNNKNK
mmetsp:Transcript_31892/g.35744  ORF Transcript_31892/g.35744 Transcript_31892/m.35744 type:complete len:210 (-) Transcript_31892:148-777(-)|eukprot:CAMPEP_0170770430 /NCGR_PEP_ID=MMETSP0733-20121128/7503_1 /TAXON_ID=186038 /ORGANISM="Fragilariopsis kerguelensis, Strain L26-C5" /LENGTH=209 /DNA_ID=CAMNT_0011112085 /DNA_START=148 /DNA_END=777 /DNA_ORIENTATION=+